MVARNRKRKDWILILSSQLLSGSQLTHLYSMNLSCANAHQQNYFATMTSTPDDCIACTMCAGMPSSVTSLSIAFNFAITERLRCKNLLESATAITSRE